MRENFGIAGSLQKSTHRCKAKLYTPKTEMPIQKSECLYRNRDVYAKRGNVYTNWDAQNARLSQNCPGAKCLDKNGNAYTKKACLEKHGKAATKRRHTRAHGDAWEEAHVRGDGACATHISSAMPMPKRPKKSDDKYNEIEPIIGFLDASNYNPTHVARAGCHTPGIARKVPLRHTPMTKQRTPPQISMCRHCVPSPARRPCAHGPHGVCVSPASTEGVLRPHLL